MGNFEGKEVRFGQAMSALFTIGTSGTSTGAVNAMFDSFTPLAGMVPMFNLLAGCIWPGGVGSGLYGFLVVAVIAVFVAGLMVGRTPEYLGKKIESREMKLAMLAVLIYPLIVLGFSGASVLLKTALDSLNNSGPHGLSEILYAFASATPTTARLSRDSTATRSGSTRRSASPCCSAASPTWSRCSRWPVRWRRRRVPASAGTFPTDGPLFIGLLDRRRHHPLSPPIFPGPVAWARRRAFPDARRQAL